jgi:hypothetical protein
VSVTENSPRRHHAVTGTRHNDPMPLPARLASLLPLLALLPVAASPETGPSATEAAWRIHSARAADAIRRAEITETRLGEAAATPEAEIRFEEFFSPVVGDRGLELSARLKSLHGKRVAVRGFMVREPKRSPGIFILAPRPARVTDDGFCMIDDVPTTSLHVVTGTGASARAEPFRPGRLLLVGVLEVGPAPMADGRNAYARLRIESPAGSARP